mmetsp:Transcript_2948/g.2542  ORF Transcript_2948/g.2542 Transcript_2948/m.2542 type:complete len:238 (+) Transcript_2948:917-1630(+)
MPEVFEEEGHFTKLVVFKAVANIFDAVVQSTEDPLVNEGKSIIVEGGKIIDEVLGNLGRHLGTELGQTEFEGIPDLVQEKSVTDNSSDIHIHVSGLNAVSQQTETKSISTTSGDTIGVIFSSSLAMIVHLILRESTLLDTINQVFQTGTIDDIDRVNNVTLTLTHLFTILVSDEIVQEYSVEGKLISEEVAHHDHLCDPEEQNIVTSFEQMSRVEVLEVFISIHIGPSEGGEGEQGG